MHFLGGVAAWLSVLGLLLPPVALQETSPRPPQEAPQPSWRRQALATEIARITLREDRKFTFGYPESPPGPRLEANLASATRLDRYTLGDMGLYDHGGGRFRRRDGRFLQEAPNARLGQNAYVSDDLLSRKTLYGAFADRLDQQLSALTGARNPAARVVGLIAASAADTFRIGEGLDMAARALQLGQLDKALEGASADAFRVLNLADMVSFGAVAVGGAGLVVKQGIQSAIGVAHGLGRGALALGSRIAASRLGRSLAARLNPRNYTFRGLRSFPHVFPEFHQARRPGLPAPPPEELVQGALLPHEVRQARQILHLLGGRIEGVVPRDLPGYDIRFTGRTGSALGSLKGTGSRSPVAVLRAASKAEAQASAAGLSRIEVFVNAPNVDPDVLLDFARHGPLTLIPAQDTVSGITVFAAEGRVIRLVGGGL